VDSHHFVEEQSPDPDPHKRKKSDSDRIQVKRWIQIRITVMLIRNPGFKNIQLKEGATMRLYLFAHLYIERTKPKKSIKIYFFGTREKIPIIKHLNSFSSGKT
jgi:hypothetical protein